MVCAFDRVRRRSGVPDTQQVRFKFIFEKNQTRTRKLAIYINLTQDAASHYRSVPGGRSDGGKWRE
jgi:hypothetical protein